MPIFPHSLRRRYLWLLVAALVLLAGAVPAQAATTSINDNTAGTASNQFQYVGGSNWIYEQRGDTYQGDDHYDNHAGDAYQVSFSGLQAQIYTTKDAGLGIMGVSIDGGSETMVDLYSSSRLTQQLVYTSPQLASGTHTLKVRVTGNKNPSAAYAFVTADRVDITGTSAPTVSLTANPASISSGQSSTLSWSAGNANSCSAPWTSQAGTSGSQSVSPTTTTTYTVTCVGSGGSTSRSVTVTVSASTSPPPSGPCAGSPAPSGGYQHVVWVVMENHSSDEITGNSAAPFENQLASECGRATNYFAISHPSLPNYVAMTSGDTQGIADDNDPSSHPLSVASIFSQLPAGASRSLQEAMPSNCAQTGSGEYAVKHNPMAYYTDLGSDCANYDVPLGATPDLSARFTFVTPNLIDDMHDGTVQQGDTWLRGFFQKIYATPQWQAGNTAVFVTFDEDEGSQNNQVYTAVVAPSVKPGTHDGTRFDHYSLLRTAEDLLGLPAIGHAASATGMEQMFNLGMSQAPQGGWVGRYGGSGYDLAAWNNGSDTVAMPGASVGLLQGSRYEWASNTSDVRALESADQSTRNAAAYYDPNQIRVQLSFSSAYSGNIELYAVDWDHVGRRETISAGGQSASLTSDFSNGAWITIPVNQAAGSTLTITVTNNGPVNAVLSGIFLN